MQYQKLSLQDFLSDQTAKNPTQEERQAFYEAINNLLQTDPKESEEHHKNNINEFLKTTFDYEINTKGRIDSAIFVDNAVSVLIEVKALNAPKDAFPTPETLESKAFYESILYYLRESKTHKNNNIKHIILCTLKDFFIIDAKEYERLFGQDKQINKFFKNTEAKAGNNATTEKFYEDIKDYLKEKEGKIAYTHCNLAYAINENETSDENLALIYSLLSPACLLKQKSTIDANVLNQDFYNELLHILGLQEITKDGKVLIVSSDTPNSLLDSITKNFDLDKEAGFEDIFSLITTWNNRILFLRLLESMLLAFQHIQKPFLHIEIIKDFKDLNTLFFDVLAKEEHARIAIPQALKNIPYLNSSLFDKTALEKDGKEIKLLDSKRLALHKYSILKKDATYKDTAELPLLEYLFAFLNAYDFTTTPKDIKNHTKINFDKLINASVLGLVFEKLNGYKEGSFYTPSFITNYMCKDALAKVVLDKFNTAKGYECQNLDELENRIDKDMDLKEANEIFNTIKICDPAVGSGHFLVAALNELILIKFTLGILCDENFKRLKDITLEISNDEIVIIDPDGKVFAYEHPAHENIATHKIQKALFNAKKDLIENCLFGVDINPNSCEITKLRLWIELLKYSYYKDIKNKLLQTLPNIDINIKDGNSLVSNFPIHTQFTIGMSVSFSQNLKKAIDDYKDQVKRYKNNIGDKNQIIKNITEVKAMLETYLIENHPKNTSLKENLRKFIFDYGDGVFDFESPFGMEMIKISRENKYRFTPTLTSLEPKELDKNGEKLLEALKSDFESLESLKFFTIPEDKRKNKPAFEWRFEFPEILDENGDFMGFDLIIGNPPYIRQESIKELKPHLEKNFDIYSGTSDIYTYFFEQGWRVLQAKGRLSFIVSNKWTRAGYGEKLRAFILEHTRLENYVDFNGIKVFDSATVDTSIISFQKSIKHQNTPVEANGGGGIPIPCHHIQAPRSFRYRVRTTPNTPNLSA
ncbi:Eco57I restriction-modification methylase domain-containing protein [Helicobacter sp. 11S02596-1]|uniref:type IIG restriction enzyme/methyltransferase n=1 Tax=Helicobacter sp. 11S02596-1 TaxID=1476194 RepID=UPI00267BF26F